MIVEMRRLLSAFLTALFLWHRGVPRDGISLRRIACLIDTVWKCFLVLKRGEPVAEQLVFRDAAGRQLTVSDLEGCTGRVAWEVIGAENVSPEAKRLHQEARAAGGRGDYARALALFDQARDLALDWPYPLYDAAYTYLLLDEARMAEELYRRVDQMAPRGYFTCKASLDTLRRERAGELPSGFAKAYATTEWMDPREKRRLLTGIVDKFPGFALAWKDLAVLLDDDASRMNAIEQGLRGRPDAETLGILLINKASILARHGDRDKAVAILGELALSPDSTLATEHLAKVVLAGLVESHEP
jgi:tetratricopeptide (TPR) repeat protein